MDWFDCKNSKLVKEASVDKNLIDALLIMSKNKHLSAMRLELDDISAETKISNLYDSLREVLEALAINKGYKIYNHECFSSFLKEICNEEEFSKKFDKLRILRNKINYYGEKIKIEQAKIFIEDLIKLKKEILDKYFTKEAR